MRGDVRETCSYAPDTTAALKSVERRVGDAMIDSEATE